jgi:hypothetical protein
LTGFAYTRVKSKLITIRVERGERKGRDEKRVGENQLAIVAEPQLTRFENGSTTIICLFCPTQQTFFLLSFASQSVNCQSSSMTKDKKEEERE